MLDKSLISFIIRAKKLMFKFLTFALKIGLAAFFLGLAISAYLFYYFSKDLPDYLQLEKYYPPCVTRIYTADGKLIEEYAKEKRIFVPINNVPKSLIQAFIAAEDKNFYSHPGVDIFSITRAAIANIFHAARGKRFEGGSTITQQVVKNFLLSSERSIERKIKEAILSYMITQTFSKDQILELYLNQLFLGKGYGVAAAALGYFNKSVEELTLTESAFLASLPKAPSQYGSEKNYKKAINRRNYVIGRMHDDGYITADEAKLAMSEPLILVKPDKLQTINADYYADQVRTEVIDLFGEEYFYTAGLTIITCADSKLQKNASKALRFGIKKWDMKRGYRGVIDNISLDNWQENIKKIEKTISTKNYQTAVILNVENSQAKIGLPSAEESFIQLKDLKWTKTAIKSVKQLFKKGDVILVKKERGHHKLVQIPEINGGIMVIEPFTGRILAIEGGYDYSVSKFNRVTRAKRQPGSLSKVFVYLAGLENGIKPNDIFEDSPLEISQGPGLPMWAPKNWDNKFMGPMTFRRGLEKSRNLVTVRVGQKVGFTKVAETLERFGINDNPPKMPSIVLGAVETTLEKVSTAFSVFANNGHKVTPHYIELIKDRKGNILYRRDENECIECKNIDSLSPPKVTDIKGKQIVDEAVNYQMLSLLTGGVERGTSHSARIKGKVIAGKTGTSNEGKDTWFIGFSPKMLVGTYIGYDTPRSLGKTATGASVALPVFVQFMKDSYANIDSIDFSIPDSIDLIPVDHDTGIPSDAPGAIIEAFKKEGYNINNPGINIDRDPFDNIHYDDKQDDLNSFEGVY